jgi:ABC-type arginine transport system, ATPase component
VFQQYHLWPHMTVLQNLIEAPMKILGVSEPEAKQQALELLQRLRLEEFADRFPVYLSGGQQQRVAIARALMMKPQVLLFDEPTAALDPEITAQIVSIIEELQQTGITQVIVTHEVNVAKKVATKVVYMEQGRIIEMGDKTCFDKPQTEQFKQYLSHNI